MNNKKILDPCCGGKMFWFNKNHPDVLYCDIREEGKGFIKGRPNFKVSPDKIIDFRDMPFKNESFKLVVFDPPHFKFRGVKSWAFQKYGTLSEHTWDTDLKKGFDECWRVLKKDGVLIFKWSTERNSRSVKIGEVLKLFNKEPLFGHPTGRSGKTMWVCFMKLE